MINNAEIVRLLLELDDHGNIENTMDNYRIIFDNDHYFTGMFYDTSKRAIMVETKTDEQKIYKEISDEDWCRMELYIESNYGLYCPPKLRESLIAYLSAMRSRNLIADYLKSLEWDNVPRLETLLIDYLGADDTIYVRTVTVKTLVAAVNRALNPGIRFDNVLVVCGKQGIGKSTLFCKLGGAWFTDSMTISDMKDKTAAEKMRGNWIIEISELAGIRKVDLETLKAFISRCDDQYREPYSVFVQTHPRACILVGTTNSTDGFLNDPTGNRRFWPVNVTGESVKKTWDMSDYERDQIWAEAYHKYLSGEPLHLSSDIEQMAIAEQKQALQSDPRLGVIDDYLRATGKQSICTIELWCECLMRERSQMSRKHANDIETILLKLGWDVYRGNKTGKTRISGYGVQKTFVKVNEDDSKEVTCV